MIKGTEAQVQGLFRIEVFGDDGHYKDYGWTKNMILDVGIEFLLKHRQPLPRDTKIFVGTGTTPPQPTDTGLENKIAETSAVSRSDGYDEVGGFGWTRFVATFGKGQISTGVSEVGVTLSWSVQGNYTSPMVARSLFRDADGTPITIPMTADNTLVITYEFRTWWITPAPYVIDYDNNGTIEQVTVTHGTAEPALGLPGWLQSSRAYFQSSEDQPQGYAGYVADFDSYVSGVIGTRLTVEVGEQIEIAYMYTEFLTGITMGYPGKLKVHFDPPLMKYLEEELVIEQSKIITRRA